MLEGRRHELMREMRTRIRKARTDRAHEHGVRDEVEISDADIQDEIGFTLLQMKAEMLDKIQAALQRISEWTYGVCVDCGDEITEARLRALPFALRCTACEEMREIDERSQHSRPRHETVSLFFESRSRS